MGLGLDLSGVDENNLENLQAGGERPKPGKGMVVVTDWVNYGAPNTDGGAHKLELEIVAWDPAESVAQTTTIAIWHIDKTGKGHPQKVMLSLALAGGLITARDIQLAKAAGTSPQIEFELLKGRPIMVVLEEQPSRKDPSKTFINVGCYGKGFFHCLDPRVKDWPMNQNILNQKRDQIGEWVVLGQETPPPPPPAATNGSPFANNS